MLSGPGTGTFLPSSDRILFAGHYLTSYRDGGAVVVYYSDDGGETYSLANNTFPRADEASITATNHSHLVVNNRMSVEVSNNIHSQTVKVGANNIFRYQ